MLYLSKNAAAFAGSSKLMKAEVALALALYIKKSGEDFSKVVGEVVAMAEEYKDELTKLADIVANIYKEAAETEVTKESIKEGDSTDTNTKETEKKDEKKKRKKKKREIKEKIASLFVKDLPEGSKQIAIDLLAIVNNLKTKDEKFDRMITAIEMVINFIEMGELDEIGSLIESLKEGVGDD